ncbi:TetR/AcrR family transcriptional regulator [Phytoactinopolyspora endophytica]|uniref:TetR/AcrR family transcriptional regulator n=1 Tax=Phytoactinopolyspora endophytica TaxID=1642495 RepID=UPI00101C37D4|nr:TetR/AcrR family transcriptional regulator [Phytoactinopolyspora endophytica]
MPGDHDLLSPLTLSSRDGVKRERADAARNRQILLEAAGRILRDKGIDALSMDAVAAEAGVGIGTVYRRFGDLQGLAYALIDDQEREFQAAFISGPPPLGPGAPPQERLCAFLRRYVDRLTEQAELMATAENGDARYRSGAYNLQRQHLAMLITQIDPERDGGYLADALLAVLSARLYLHQRAGLEMTVERLNAGLDQLVRGVIG